MRILFFFSGKKYIGSSLTLADVRNTDTGEIWCIANNSITPPVSHKFQLTIHCEFYIVHNNFDNL